MSNTNRDKRHSKTAADADARLVSIDRFGRIVGVSKDTAYRTVANGEIASVRIGRRRLIDRTDIERFIEQRKEAATAL